MTDSAPSSFSLVGKRIIVTGAAGGIGAAVVAGALRSGASVVAVDRELSMLDGLEGVDRRGLDLRSVPAIEAFVDEEARGSEPVDSLIHCAGVLLRTADLDEVTEADWDLQHDVNLKAAFFLNRAIARAMSGRGGSIVNFASQGWWTGGFGGSVAYNASKGGLVTLTRGLARTYAARGVRVNSIAPGAVDTAMMRDGLDDDFRKEFIAQIPLGRMASPDEVADAALFLASDASRYMTGATLNVSGGQLMY